MDNNHKRQNFLAYINKPISKESMNMLYEAHNIKYEKCELYSDFVQSLLRIAFDTYMGDDVTSVDQQVEHFKWCWEKNLDNFNKEGLLFNNPKLYSYFLEFMLEVFYSMVDKKESNYTDKSILKLWYDIFDYNKGKTTSDIDTLIEIYQLMDCSLNPTP